MTFSPNGKLLVSVLEHKTARFWDLGWGELPQRIEGVSTALFSPNSKLLATASDKAIRLRDADSRGAK
jgi:WD40 repeat protein